MLFRKRSQVNKTLFILLLILKTSLLRAQHTNVVIDNVNGADEPSIAMDIKNPARMVAGGNIANIYYSSDTGKTWTRKLQTSTYGVWGDPVMACDTAGHFYHFHLSNPSFGSWIDRIVCQKSTDGGKTYNNGSFMGLNGQKNQDKHWVSIDRRTNTIYCTWTQFDKYESRDPQDSSHIMFSKSLDGGITWSDAKRINTTGGDCLDDDNTVEGAVPHVGLNGEVVVAWAGPKGLMFQKSTDGGATWLPQERKISDMPGGWSQDVSGIYRCNGLPVTVVDTGSSPYRGTIYVNWADQRNGSTNTDIWLVKSTDGGNSWSTPRRVNSDNSTRQQFFTWMSVDPVTGYLWFVFYDRRNHNNDSTDVYLAFSKDGGEHFTNVKISEKPFKPLQTAFFGDYTNIVAYNNIVRPIWTAMNMTGRKTIYTALVNTPALVLSTEGVVHVSELINLIVYPNPTQQEVTFEFELRSPNRLSLCIFDTMGEELATIFRHKSFAAGRHRETFNIKKLKSSDGILSFILKNRRGKKMSSGNFMLVR